MLSNPLRSHPVRTLFPAIALLVVGCSDSTPHSSNGGAGTRAENATVAHNDDPSTTAPSQGESSSTASTARNDDGDDDGGDRGDSGDSDGDDTRWTPSPDPKLATFLGLEAPKPATWIEHPPSRLHCIATYILPGRDGHPQAHINVFYLGEDSGGTPEANIAMWAQQFRTPEGDEIVPKVRKIEVDGMPVTVAQYRGEYMPKASSYFKPNHEMLVSIVESPRGMVFIELLGVTETAEIHRDAYLQMIQNLRRADKDETEAG